MSLLKVCVIPARGGSKRIPRKNIKLFSGKPMIVWSIDAAKNSGLFDRIIVSTDDNEIAQIAMENDAEVPFMRSVELSNDYAGTTEVVAHASQWILGQGVELQAVCCIYATAPFIQVSDIKQGWDVFSSSNWDYVFSATEFSASIFRSFKHSPGNGVEMVFPEYFMTRSQELPVALHDAAQFYWGKASAWIEGKRIFDYHSKPIIIPRWRVQDIDTADDWRRAELVYETLISQKAIE